MSGSPPLTPPGTAGRAQPRARPRQPRSSSESTSTGTFGGGRRIRRADLRRQRDQQLDGRQGSRSPRRRPHFLASASPPRFPDLGGGPPALEPAPEPAPDCSSSGSSSSSSVALSQAVRIRLAADGTLQTESPTFRDVGVQAAIDVGPWGRSLLFARFVQAHLAPLEAAQQTTVLNEVQDLIRTRVAAFQADPQ
jgi:hypothetical protein